MALPTACMYAHIGLIPLRALASSNPHAFRRLLSIHPPSTPLDDNAHKRLFVLRSCCTTTTSPEVVRRPPPPPATTTTPCSSKPPPTACWPCDCITRQCSTCSAMSCRCPRSRYDIGALSRTASLFLLGPAGCPQGVHVCSINNVHSGRCMLPRCWLAWSTRGCPSTPMCCCGMSQQCRLACRSCWHRLRRSARRLVRHFRQHDDSC